MKIIELKNNKFKREAIKELLNKNICLIGVFSKLCIHCQNMKPQWEMLKKKLKKTKCNGLLLELDSSQLNYIDYSSLTNSIKGFPSIAVYKNGKFVKEYNGNRKTDDMFKFFKPYLVITKPNKITRKLLKKRKNKNISKKIKHRSKNKKSRHRSIKN